MKIPPRTDAKERAKEEKEVSRGSQSRDASREKDEAEVERTSDSS